MQCDMDDGEKIHTTPQMSAHNRSWLRSSFGNTDSDGYHSFTSHSSSYESGYQSKLFSFTAKKKLRKSGIEPYPTRSNRNFNNSESNSFDDSGLEQSVDSYRMKLRSYGKKQMQSSISTSESHDSRNVSSVPSMSATSSTPSVEELIHGVKTKLYIPQSTPFNCASAVLPNSSQCASGSNKTRPKKLDFSKRAILASFHKQRVTSDYTSKETVDILKLLGEKSHHPRIISRILGYLSPNDLCSINIVSKSWRRICGNDVKAQERRLRHIILMQCSKENLASINKAKLKEEAKKSSPRSRYRKRELLTAVSTNSLRVPKIHLPPGSPAVSPSKVIFHSFVKAGQSLSPCDQLVQCPQCKFACRVKPAKNVGICSRKGCLMEEFCVLCFSKSHVGERCKMPLLATPTKLGEKQPPVAGTKQCRKNLRRISRLS